MGFFRLFDVSGLYETSKKPHTIPDAKNRSGSMGIYETGYIERTGRRGYGDPAAELEKQGKAL